MSYFFASRATATSFASPADTTAGDEYPLLAAPQPSQAAGKQSEVIEFFTYHCPYCHAIEPALEQWVKKQGNNILTLQAMGQSEAYQARLFDTVGDIVTPKRSETLTEQ